MDIEIFTQKQEENQLSEVLKHYLTEDYKFFRVLTAFTSHGGLNKIDDELTEFLDGGSTVELIIGVESKTSYANALDYLLYVSSVWSDQTSFKIFNSGSYHPKFYWFGNDDEEVVVLGSNNLTAGGLKNNFETYLVITASTDDSDFHADVADIWSSYSDPDNISLVDVDRDVVESIKQEIEDSREDGIASEQRNGRRAIQDILSAAEAEPEPAGDVLVMEVMEGPDKKQRQTQVQFPKETISNFWEADPDDPNKKFTLSFVEDGSIVQSETRTIVKTKSRTWRVEMSAVKGLELPILARITKVEPDEFEYEIITSSSPTFEELDTMLDTEGNQYRPDARRWLIVEAEEQ